VTVDMRSTGGGAVLTIRDLVVEFDTGQGPLRAVDGISLDVYPGETLGIVGESGSGKSVSMLSVLSLLPQPAGRMASGEILFNGQDLTAMSPRELRSVRGRDIGMVFQDPMTSLNPVLRVGYQIMETLLEHNDGMTKQEARARAIELLELVQVPDAPKRADNYPHQYSGGMRQRGMIALAMANRPKLLIADEPTTALDVTIQAQVLDALQEAQRETHASMIIITHDLGIIAELADRVIVMYAGRIVESGDVHTIFKSPKHPYTVGLLDSLPRLDADGSRLTPIDGQPPRIGRIAPGCAFSPRCRLRQDRERCVTEQPELADTRVGSRSACHFHDELLARKVTA
jgi:oligopeptide/dipeptide ABC transporter ATP-binding protein